MVIFIYMSGGFTTISKLNLPPSAFPFKKKKSVNMLYVKHFKLIVSDVEVTHLFASVEETCLVSVLLVVTAEQSSVPVPVLSLLMFPSFEQLLLYLHFVNYLFYVIIFLSLENILVAYWLTV